MRVFWQQELGNIAFYEEGEKDWSTPLCTTQNRENANKIKEAINEPAAEVTRLTDENLILHQIIGILAAPNEFFPCERYEDYKTYFGCNGDCAPCRVKWATEWQKGWRPGQ